MLNKYFLSIFSLLLYCNHALTQTIKDEPIVLKNCNINVTANMFTAVTELRLEFFNPNGKVLDGEFNFALQEGQVVTGFALDINGHLREGVMVDKQKGRVAYENTIRRRVDPGLLEMTAGNNYRVRIYPMPAMGTRKIKIEISQLLINKFNALQYQLPLDISYQIAALSVAVKVNHSIEPPITADGLLKEKDFEKEGDDFTLSVIEKNIILKQPLSFEIPLVQHENIFCSNLTSPDANFVLHVKPSLERLSAPALHSVAVFWDVSATAQKRDVEKELDFLQLFLQEKKITAIRIITFSNAVHSIEKFSAGQWGSIRRFLTSLSYDGGTQLGSLDCSKNDADVFLLFSDGLNSFGSDKIKMNGKAVYCVNSSPAANHNLLHRIAAASGGDYIDLNLITLSNAAKLLQSVSLQLLDVKQKGSSIKTNLSLPMQFTDWLTITGNLENTTDDLVLSFGKDAVVLKEEKISLQSVSNCDSEVLVSANFLQQYASLQSKDPANPAVISFAKLNHFVSGSTSFIVLDNVDDYIQYGIEPPADLQQQYIEKRYVVEQKAAQQKAAMANEEINNLLNAVNLYNERITWWGADQKLIDLKEVEIKKEPLYVSGQKVESGENQNSKMTEVLKGSGSSLNEVVVVGYGTRRRKDLTGSVTVISASELATSQVVTVDQALQGKIAGAQISSNYAVGGTDRVYVRGIASLPGGGKPLYILDGMPADASIINMINTNEIASITVFRGAEAGALYGSEGANGVIVVNRKTATDIIRKKSGTQLYDDLDEESYISELRIYDNVDVYAHYLQMKDKYAGQSTFYFEVALLLFEKGDKDNAVRVLSNLAEIENENHQMLRALGYVLETWKMYPEAIEVYKKVLEIKEEEPQSYRDLALAYEHDHQYQAAVDLLYTITTKNFYQYENRYQGLKSLLMNEMNAIINRHRNELNLSAINNAVIRPLPVDLRVVVDWNKDETDIDLHIIEPAGEECYYSHKLTASKGRLSEDFTQGYGPEEYQLKSAKKGAYHIQVNYFGDRYQKKQVPSIIRLTVYKNFGTANQTVNVQSFIMENLNGKIEIADISF